MSFSDLYSKLPDGEHYLPIDEESKIKLQRLRDIVKAYPTYHFFGFDFYFQYMHTPPSATPCQRGVFNATFSGIFVVVFVGTVMTKMHLMVGMVV